MTPRAPKPRVHTPVEDRTTVQADLETLADLYEQNQTTRVQNGNRIHAALRGEDYAGIIDLESWLGPITDPVKGTRLYTGADVLADIQRDITDGPIPVLGRTYRRNWEAERDAFKAMEDALEEHAAWTLFMKYVKGVGPTLAAKMLARLDIHEADTISAFWAYAGLSTVPGERYRCETCKLVRGFPVGYNVKGGHKALNTNTNCKGTLVKVAGPEDGVRVAKPRSVAGKERDYDAYMKKVMYVLASTWLKIPGCFFRERYDAEKRRLEVERPGWAKGRIHLTALRKCEKLFLSLLWQVWREAEGLPVTEPYVVRHLGHDASGIITPEEVLAFDNPDWES